MSTTRIKKLNLKSQPAEVNNKSEASQRLNTENLEYAYLVGLIEADGWFTFFKNNNYITFEMGIELHRRDIELLSKIKALLGAGNIREVNKKVRFSIRKKEHLKEIVFPIFDKYPMLSNKYKKYVTFKQLLLHGCVYYTETGELLKSTIFENKCINEFNVWYRIQHNLQNQQWPNYFSAWLVGFIEGEGCFSVYYNSRLFKKPYPIASFDIGQTKNKVLVVAIHNFLQLDTNVLKKKDSDFFFFKVTSVKDISSVISFINLAPIKLLGYKKLQYLLWLKKLRNIKRYSNVI